MSAGIRPVLKKVLRRASYVLGAVVAVVGVLALYVQIDGVPKYTPETPVIEVARTPAALARGKTLVTLLCTECHENSETHRLTGKHIEELPSEFGDIYSKNITGDPSFGIGGWTDGQLIYFLRTGVRPDGQYVPPWMAKLPHVSDEDLHAIVAFLRSGDPLVTPTPTPPVGTTKPSFLSKALTHTVFKPLPFPKAPIPTPPRSDKLAYGRYMTFTLECWTCHSEDFKSMNVMEPEKTPGFMGGGNVLMDGEKKPIHAPNLTADDETGIGRWSEADFVRAVTKGVRPDGRVLHYPMLPRTGLDDEEVAAIYAYLRTVPKLRHAVPRPANAMAAAAVSPASAGAGAGTGAGHPGKPLYEKYGCGACHGASGVGLGGDLRGANEHHPSDEALRAWIEDAPKMKPGTRMPPWKGVIRDEDYAPLMGYVRTLSRPGKSASR